MFQPEPGVAHIWSDFSRLNQCSTKGPSWLYQEYNRYTHSQDRLTNTGPLTSRVHARTHLTPATTRVQGLHLSAMPPSPPIAPLSCAVYVSMLCVLCRHVRRQLWGGDNKAPPRPSRPQVTFLVRKRKIGGGGMVRTTYKPLALPHSDRNAYIASLPSCTMTPACLVLCVYE